MQWLDLRDTPSAARVLHACGVTAAPVWPDDILEALGIHLHSISEHPGWEAACRVTPGRADIWFWLSGDAGRDNFFIAFELGRVAFCPYGTYRDSDFAFSDGDKRDAYGFAEELLIPSQWIRHYGRSVGYDVNQLAAIFLVQPSAIDARLRRLRNRSIIRRG